MSKHTTGPWIVNNDQTEVGEGKLSIEAADEYFIAQVDEGVSQEANARLIAAAPELLSALKDIIGWVPGAASWHTDAPIKAVERARAAIAKATRAD